MHKYGQERTVFQKLFQMHVHTIICYTVEKSGLPVLNTVPLHYKLRWTWRLPFPLGYLHVRVIQYCWGVDNVVLFDIYMDGNRLSKRGTQPSTFIRIRFKMSPIIRSASTLWVSLQPTILFHLYSPT